MKIIIWLLELFVPDKTPMCGCGKTVYDCTCGRMDWNGHFSYPKKPD